MPALPTTLDVRSRLIVSPWSLGMGSAGNPATVPARPRAEEPPPALERGPPTRAQALRWQASAGKRNADTTDGRRRGLGATPLPGHDVPQACECYATMVTMPARRGQGSRSPSPPPEEAILKIPLPRAKSDLEERITIGRELAQTAVPSLEGSPRTVQMFFEPPFSRRTAEPAYPELDALRNQVGQWRDYNQTWLDSNLGGEAAQEYRAASQHWGSAMADDPVTRLRYLREDVAKEISKLESIRDRLSLWSPEAGAGTPDPDAAELSPTTPIAPERAKSAEPATDFATNRKVVMVIYGHDQEANEALFDWLRAIGLEPREWTQLVQATGSGSPYIGQVLDQAFTQAQAVVALFTPDERVVARTADATDPSGWRLQARPNVLIEAGMALVTHPTRTILATLGDLELPSDLAGRYYVRLSHTDVQPLHDLAGRLQTAGCQIDTTGAQWLNPSRFPDRTQASRSPDVMRHAALSVTHSGRPDPADSDAQIRAAERRAREDSEARQVVASIEKADSTTSAHGPNVTHLITVSCPSTYPIKQVEGQVVWQGNSGGFSMTGFGYGGDTPRAGNGRIWYPFRASISPQVRNPEVVIRFVDQHGNRFYQFRLHTQRFPGRTDWIDAMKVIDLWLRTGPNPD